MKISNILIYIFFLNLFLIQTQSFCSEPFDSEKQYRFKIGLLLGIDKIDHSTNLPIIMDNANCGAFASGNSIGKNIGVVFEYNYIPHLLDFDSKILFSNFDASFSSSKYDFRVYNPNQQNYQNVVLKYSFSSNIILFSLQPSIFIQPVKHIPLKIRLGAEISNPISIPSYHTSEEIVSPKIFTFPDQTQKHIIDNGVLNQLATSFSVISGLQYEHQIKEKLFLSLELFYQIPLSSRTSNFKWETTEYGFNVMLSYGFNSLFSNEEIKSEPTKIKQPQETTETPSETVITKIEPVKLKIKPEPIKVMETTVTEAYPLLPYIFFDEKSNKLNKKYLQNFDKNFDEASLPHNSIEIYYRILDIIGKRLQINPKLRITIIGHSDGIEFSTKQEREEIALARAKEVESYLINKWNIKSEQMNLEYKEKPILSTSNLYEQGPAENRRVEIKADDNLLLKPILLTKFKEYRMLSDQIDIELHSDNINSLVIKNFEVIGQKVDNFHKFSLDKIHIPIGSEIQNKIIRQIEKSNSLDCKVTYLADDSIKTTFSEIPYEIEKNTFEFQRLNLIVFDFDKYEINPVNYEILKNFVASSIQENSEVRIIGSTDILGSKEYNLQLSKQRANETKNTLQKIKPKANFIEVEGIGDSNLKYDNSTPEGRFYSRTVLIEVKTPIKNK